MCVNIKSHDFEGLKERRCLWSVPMVNKIAKLWLAVAIAVFSAIGLLVLMTIFDEFSCIFAFGLCAGAFIIVGLAIAKTNAFAKEDKQRARQMARTVQARIMESGLLDFEEEPVPQKPISSRRYFT